MTRAEFQNLAVGDYVTYKGGPDAGKLYQVVFIEDYNNICLRAMCNATFAPTVSNSKRNNVKLKVVTGVGIYKF